MTILNFGYDFKRGEWFIETNPERCWLPTWDACLQWGKDNGVMLRRIETEE